MRSLPRDVRSVGRLIEAVVLVSGMSPERQAYGRSLLDAIEEEGVSIEGVSIPEEEPLDEWTIKALEVSLLRESVSSVDLQPGGMHGTE